MFDPVDQHLLPAGPGRFPPHLHPRAHQHLTDCPPCPKHRRCPPPVLCVHAETCLLGLCLWRLCPCPVFPVFVSASSPLSSPAPNTPLDGQQWVPLCWGIRPTVLRTFQELGTIAGVGRPFGTDSLSSCFSFTDPHVHNSGRGDPGYLLLWPPPPPFAPLTPPPPRTRKLAGS